MIQRGRTAIRLLTGSYVAATPEPFVDAADVPQDSPALPFRADRTLATATGREAIRWALKAIGHGPGSATIVPDYACRGVIDPILSEGRRPVFYGFDEDFRPAITDVSESDLGDVDSLILVHLYGLTHNNRASIIDWANERGIVVIEDLAQAWRSDTAERLDDSVAFTVGSMGPGKPIPGPRGGWLGVNHEPYWRDSRLSEYSSLEEVRERLDDCPTPDPPADTVNPKRTAQRALVRRLLRRNDSKENRHPPLSGMSMVARRMLAHSYPYLGAAERVRSEHKRTLRDLVGDQPGIHWPSAPSDNALKTPVLLRHRRLRDELARRLWATGIQPEAPYVPLPRRTDLPSFTYPGQRTPADDLAERTILIPVHENVPEDHCHKVAELIKSLTGATSP